MKFGMLHLFESPEGRTEQEIIGEQLDLMQAAEGAGFDSIWPAEHHFTEYGYCVSPALTLAAIARVTTRIRLGTGVVVLPFHDPVRVAEEYAFLDVMSGGRLEFGVGRGYQPNEYRGHRVDAAHSHGLFRESLEIIVQAWTQERVNYAGEHFTVTDQPVRPKPLQKPHPPIWIASLSPESFELCGKLGANLLYSPTFTPEDKAREGIHKRLNAYRETLRAAGHDPATKRIGALRMIYVADSTEEARRDFEDPVIWYYRTISNYIAPPAGEAPLPSYDLYPRTRDFAASVDYESLVDGGAVIAGDPDYCCRMIEAYQEEYGFTDLLCWTRLGGMDPHKVMRSMELMDRHVIPHFKEQAVASAS